MFGKRNHSETPDPSQPPADSPDNLSADAGFEDLQQRIDQLTTERDEANNRAVRAMADFQNYQRRSLQNEIEAKRQGVTSVILSVLPVLDHFDLALTQATPDDASRRILDGVRVIRAELIKVIESHGVVLINPQPNDEFDPNRHSAIMQQPADGVEAGRVSACFQPGYVLGDRVIRSAKVAVAPATEPPPA